MDSNIDKVREALEIADAFCGRHTADECPDTIAIPIKDDLAALSAIDQDAIRLAQRMKSLLQSISSWFACWGIATKDDLWQSVEEFDREITAILSAEPAQDDGKPEAGDIVAWRRKNGVWQAETYFDDWPDSPAEVILMRSAEVKRRIEGAKE